ncbi:MAG: tRNA (adenosine(37)-N6)-threonylcarbamoyltransferase complex dimerization subunit type 1 TsaB [Pseudomonadota bacterium]|nr:tRNA (adenosine(37)-N6)-threonylcarbamoyltransferase complex dimerization subunit type 1 TsaB [Pseudomonadota bacterium]
MPTLLAIDTCSTKCKVALLQQGRVSFREGTELRKAAQNVLVLIDNLLAEAGLVYNQLDALAVVTGPGSFTGVRMGVAIAQGLSLSSSTPVVPISSLAILASAASQKFDGDLFLSCMKARENEVYFGVYQRTGDDVILVGSEQVNAAGAISSEELAGERLRIFIGVGDGWIYREQLEKSLNLELAHCIHDNFTSMEDFCRLAAARFRKGDVVKEEQVLPNYVKEQMDYS